MITSDISVKLIQSMGGDDMVVRAAKVSTEGSAAVDAGTSEGLIRYLMRQKHGTPFEHAAMTFFVHAPIFVWREWHRHRIGFSYNEESGRYKKLENIFWVPRRERPMMPVPEYKAARPQFLPVGDLDYAWLVSDLEAGYNDAYMRYERRLERGFSKEVARVGLPLGIYSSCWVTCNPRSLMNFLSLRTHDLRAAHKSYPQSEIEEAARICETFLATGWPLTYKAFNDFGRVSP